MANFDRFQHPSFQLGPMSDFTVSITYKLADWADGKTDYEVVHVSAHDDDDAMHQARLNIDLPPGTKIVSTEIL